MCYQQEADLFHENLSERIIQDDVLQRLVTFPNVIVTSHQAYFTGSSSQNIAITNVANLTEFERGDTLVERSHPRDAALNGPCTGSHFRASSPGFASRFVGSLA